MIRNLFALRFFFFAGIFAMAGAFLMGWFLRPRTPRMETPSADEVLPLMAPDMNHDIVSADASAPPLFEEAEPSEIIEIGTLEEQIPKSPNASGLETSPVFRSLKRKPNDEIHSPTPLSTSGTVAHPFKVINSDNLFTWNTLQNSVLSMDRTYFSEFYAKQGTDRPKKTTSAKSKFAKVCGNHCAENNYYLFPQWEVAESVALILVCQNLCSSVMWEIRGFLHLRGFGVGLFSNFLGQIKALLFTWRKRRFFSKHRVLGNSQSVAPRTHLLIHENVPHVLPQLRGCQREMPYK